MNEIIWKTLFMVLYVVLILIRLPYARMHRRMVIKSSERPAVESFLVSLNMVTMMILPMLALFSPWLDPFSMHLPEWARGAGLAAFALSVPLYFWTHHHLGAYWSPILEIKEEHKLIVDGPYRFMRHPMYTQIWMWVLFQGIALDNWLVEIAGIVSWSILFFIRVPREERMMIDEFGERYWEFKRMTGCVLPRLLRPKSAQ